MPGIAAHLVFRAVDSRVLAPTVGARRRLARALVQVGNAYGLLAFGAADTHVHVLLLGSAAPGPGAHALALAVRHATGLPVPMERTRILPVDDQIHLGRAFFYTLGQAAHHGVGFDPLREATSLPDLLGLRPGGHDVIARVRAALPRVGRDQLLASLGVPHLNPTLLLDHVHEAACAAAGTVDLAGRTPRILAARRAALALTTAQLTTRAAATRFGLAPRSARRDRASPADPAWIRAVGLQMGLRAHLGPAPDDDAPRSQAPRAPAPAMSRSPTIHR